MSAGKTFTSQTRDENPSLIGLFRLATFNAPSQPSRPCPSHRHALSSLNGRKIIFNSTLSAANSIAVSGVVHGCKCSLRLSTMGELAGEYIRRGGTRVQMKRQADKNVVARRRPFPYYDRR